MGESSGAELSIYGAELESFSVETPGGRIHIRRDYEASATPNAQLAFFAEFLATAGVYESWVASCPLTYSSGNASQKWDVLGTWFLSILAGHHRYAHSPDCAATHPSDKDLSLGAPATGSARSFLA